MEEMIKVELPVDEWMKMERNHEIVENFLIEAEIFGIDNAEVNLLDKLDELLKEEQR